MAATTLDDLVKQQKGTNTRLDSVDDRFAEFFQQIAKDKLAMMEMIREMAPRDEVMPASATPSPEKDDGGGLGLLGGLGVAGLLAGLSAGILALGLNSLGAVVGIDKMSAGLKSLGAKFSAWVGNVGAKFKSIGSSVLTSLTEKIKVFSAKVKGFVGPAAAGAASKVSSIKAAGVAKVEGVRKGIVNLIAPTMEKTKSGRVLGETFKDAKGKLQTIVKNVDGKLVPQFAKAGAVVGGAAPATVTGAIGKRFSDTVTALKDSKAGKFVGKNIDTISNVGGKVIKVASKIAAPLAVATAGYEGYKLGTEDPNLSTEGKIAVGAAGAASSLVGGFADFAKLITVDAFIEAGQRLGVVPEKGFLQDLQEGSIQRQLDKGIRAARDYAVRPAATEEIGRQTMASVRQGNIIVTNVNNVNAPTTTQNNVSSTSSDQMSSPVNGNGSRSDAYVMG